MAEVNLTPPHDDTAREAAVVALLVPPWAPGSCGPQGGADTAELRAFDCQVLLIERAGGGPHRGQIALPGGKLEPGETPEQAGVRELHEELGIDADDPRHGIRFAGRLDPFYIPASNFLIHVLVAVAPEVPEIREDPREVAATVGVALGMFDPRLELAEVDDDVDGVALRYGYVPVHGGRRIWGATARVLGELASRCATI
ncbi:MAG: hypothetical protein RLZZ432_377 [Chloroflexota bacterium]